MNFKIAYQLYSARDIFDGDPVGILKSIKESGYDGVELAGYCGFTPHYLRGICDAPGLKIVSIHLSFWTLTENVPETVRNLQALGCDYAAIPGAFNLFIGNERYAYFLKEFEKLGNTLRSAGIRLLYHNHDYEFEKSNGDLALDVLYNSLDREAVQTELDCGFATYKGVDPVPYIRKYRGRIPVIHLKDFNYNEGTPGDFSTFASPVGEGVLDLPGILTSAEYAGTEWLVVEQDSQSWRGLDTLECVAKSVSNLKKLFN